MKIIRWVSAGYDHPSTPGYSGSDSKMNRSGRYVHFFIENWTYHWFMSKNEHIFETCSKNKKKWTH